jgi:hypothetical protein
MIQKIIAAVVLLIIFSVTFAKVPYLINYQGKLTDPGGNPVTDGEYTLTFSIWVDSTSTCSCNRVWQSLDNSVLVINGLFNFQLGSKEILSPSIIDTDTTLWLGIKIGDDPEIMPRRKLVSVPYSYKAYRADFAYYADSAGFALGPASHADLLNDNTDASGNVYITYPPGIFKTTPSLSVTAQFVSSGLGQMGQVMVTNHTYDGFTLNVKDGTGSNHTGSVQISYVAVEK